MREHFVNKFLATVAPGLAMHGNFGCLITASAQANQQQTNEAFTDKWARYERSEEKNRLYDFQLQWYLKLYGFTDERALKEHLATCDVIFDAGCGLGYKSAWFARLAPHALVIGMDFSDAAQQAAIAYADIQNLLFIQGDIANTGFLSGSIDYVSCDQVIMHTENPELTFTELARIVGQEGQVACYFYAKKALPRELLDDHFRIHTHTLTHEALWEMSEQLTELGRRLSELNVCFDAPDVPLLGIKGGRIDIQRFIYWNFLKCFWNPELGSETSVVTNFDWYSPSNARRFNETEIRRMVADMALRIVHFHSEEACYSGRFARQYSQP
jgi:ubiquinone/menaquinone biosynthesis C-methylase UbiE